MHDPTGSTQQILKRLLGRLTYRPAFVEALLCTPPVVHAKREAALEGDTDMKCLALIFVALVGTAVAGFAQTPEGTSWPPVAGTRARILSPVLGAERQVGRIESVSGDTLQFRRAEALNSVSLKPSDITMIEVSAGSHTAKAKWGAIGFLVGAAAGAGIASATYKPCKDSFACIGDIGGRSGSVALGAIAGALSGAAAGVLWGGRRHETWMQVSH